MNSWGPERRNSRLLCHCCSRMLLTGDLAVQDNQRSMSGTPLATRVPLPARKRPAPQRAALAAIVFWGSGAWAQVDWSSPQVHGFVSQGFIKTTRYNYLAKSKRGSFEFTEAGINITQQLGESLRIGVQLFSRDLGPIGNYSPQFDWYYLDYRFADWLGFRAGRLKIPWGLYNETNDVDSGRVPVLLPQSLYPATARELLFAQTGFEVYGDLPLGDAGALQYRAYAGTIFLNAAETSPQLREFEVPYVVGGRLLWQTPLEGLRVGGSAQKLRLDFDFSPTEEQRAQFEMDGELPQGSSGLIQARIPAWLWVASIEYQVRALLLAAEYGRTSSRLESSLNRPRHTDVREGFYVMAAYQIAPWFTPGLYYSILSVDTPTRTGENRYQHDWAATLRYDLTANWLLKLEGHYMHGLAALQVNLNPNPPGAPLGEDWGVLLVKTTAYF